MTNRTEDRAEDQAAAQYSSIVEMLAAVECDYDRLAELRDEREELTEAVKDAEDDEREAAERHERIRELHAQGLSYRAIAEAVGLKSPSAVHYALKKAA